MWDFCSGKATSYNVQAVLEEILYRSLPIPKVPVPDPQEINISIFISDCWAPELQTRPQWQHELLTSRDVQLNFCSWSTLGTIWSCKVREFGELINYVLNTDVWRKDLYNTRLIVVGHFVPRTGACVFIEGNVPRRVFLSYIMYKRTFREIRIEKEVRIPWYTVVLHFSLTFLRGRCQINMGD